MRPRRKKYGLWVRIEGKGRVCFWPKRRPVRSLDVSRSTNSARSAGNYYNAQAAVATDSMLVVASDVTQATNDKQQVAPMLGKIAHLPDELGACRSYFATASMAPPRWPDVPRLATLAMCPPHKTPSTCS
jgi:hypothetical protein